MNDNQSAIVLISMAGCISVVVMAILALVIVLVVRNQSGGGGGGGGGGSVGSGSPIPIGTYPFPKGKEPWYSHTGGHAAISAHNGNLRIQLKKTAQAAQAVVDSKPTHTTHSQRQASNLGTVSIFPRTLSGKKAVNSRACVGVHPAATAPRDRIGQPPRAPFE